jgi:hypothetical protein
LIAGGCAFRAWTCALQHGLARRARAAHAPGRSVSFLTGLRTFVWLFVWLRLPFGFFLFWTFIDVLPFVIFVAFDCDWCVHGIYRAAAAALPRHTAQHCARFCLPPRTLPRARARLLYAARAAAASRAAHVTHNTRTACCCSPFGRFGWFLFWFLLAFVLLLHTFYYILSTLWTDLLRYDVIDDICCIISAVCCVNGRVPTGNLPYYLFVRSCVLLWLPLAFGSALTRIRVHAGWHAAFSCRAFTTRCDIIVRNAPRYATALPPGRVCSRTYRCWTTRLLVYRLRYTLPAHACWISLSLDGFSAVVSLALRVPLRTYVPWCLPVPYHAAALLPLLLRCIHLRCSVPVLRDA